MYAFTPEDWHFTMDARASVLAFEVCVSCALDTYQSLGILQLDWTSAADPLGSSVPTTPACHHYRLCLGYPPYLWSIYSRQWDSLWANVGKGDQDHCSWLEEKSDMILTQIRVRHNYPSHHSDHWNRYEHEQKYEHQQVQYGESGCMMHPSSPLRLIHLPLVWHSACTKYSSS